MILALSLNAFLVVQVSSSLYMNVKVAYHCDMDMNVVSKAKARRTERREISIQRIPPMGEGPRWHIKFQLIGRQKTEKETRMRREKEKQRRKLR